MLLILISCSIESREPPTPDKDPFLILSREQSLGYSYATMLKEFGQKDLKSYASGIQLYAEARADFNGVIESMKNHLIRGESFDDTRKYSDQLKATAEKRFAFTSHVKRSLTNTEGTRALPIDLLSGVGELIKALTDVGKTIWREYRDVNDTRQRDMLKQLESLKWKPFSKI